MSAFKFHTTFRPTGDQQEDVIAKIDILRSCAVQANLTHQHNHDAQTFLKKLRQIDDELEGGGWIAWKIILPLSGKKRVI